MKKRNINMTKKQPYPIQPVHRINLLVPIVRNDSYEIYYTISPPQTRQPSTIRPVTRQKPLIDINHPIKPNNPSTTTTGRSPARVKHRLEPISVNFFTDMPPILTQSSSTVVDSISNALINSGYSGQTLRTLPSLVKHNQRQGIKDDSEKSQTSASDRLLFDSLSSFEDPFMHKTKQGMWYNVQHPQFTAIKVLHARKQSTGVSNSNDLPVRAPPPTSSFGHASQETITVSNKRLYEKVEQLTKNYFPSIQQLRHGHPCPALITNRLHLHREEKRDFVPEFFLPPIDR